VNDKGTEGQAVRRSGGKAVKNKGGGQTAKAAVWRSGGQRQSGGQSGSPNRPPLHRPPTSYRR